MCYFDLIQLISKAYHTYLEEGKESQHCIRFPVALDDGFWELRFPQLFGSHLNLMIPVSVT